MKRKAKKPAQRQRRVGVTATDTATPLAFSEFAKTYNGTLEAERCQWEMKGKSAKRLDAETIEAGPLFAGAKRQKGLFDE